MTHRTAVRAALATEVAFVAWLVAAGTRGGGPESVTNALVVLAGVGAAATCVVAARRHPRRRAGWLALASAVVLWSAAGALRAWQSGGALTTKVLPVADLAALVAPVLAIVGTLGLARSLAEPANRLRALLDGLIVAASLLFAAWALVPPPRVAETDGLATVVLLVIRPATAVAAAAVAAMTSVRGRRQERVVLGLVSVALFAVSLADGALAEATLAGVTLPRGLHAAAWLAGYLLVGLAAWHPSPPSARVAIAFDDVARSSLWAIVLPYVPLLGAGYVAVPRLLNADALDARVAGDAVVLVGLVIGRQLVTLLENRDLVRALHHTVKELRRRERDLHRMASHDGLTGLANRVHFWDRVEVSVSAARTRNRHLAVVYLDLDGFKEVNDRFGHAAGDALLTSVATRLRECVRGGETVARLGGDEFAVLLDAVDHRSAEAVAARLLVALGNPFFVDGVPIRLGASIGIAHWDGDVSSADELVRRADGAMYRAKAAGKNRVEISV